ncbi:MULTISPECIES: SDR family oxidoreductase [unclassified Methylophaga]|jgi:uncharacterized protein YbjT (DUF2867 family)|uniref:SDR family oxidoreductase n=1 Tax=unclassified Methylophaga TaxID=2629249 RepID=UPI000C905405|nr:MULTISPECIES: SDR family oxidoreductase [unclassified Methylophaga]MAK67110.1 oxidoreductase [Methylophaga sp.]MAY18148.1 oxidoreductase [Methylophaga sp.]MBN45571.1 oxidoreductase [Methylophaga sp.]HAO24396.1 oxidoreductase [Methylophaga sp.]HCD06362.1 oxidoreductase [Methylophaga sp.]|tara:strand:- start:52388 stop:53050 length:663 start_codon:yes stop_codon:yes gene_type:complete
MNKTLVIGANGQIGKLLVQMMTEQKLPVKVMLRKAEQATEFEQMGAEVVIADLEEELPDDTFTDCDKVVFTAGSGGKTGADKTILVDLWGACKSIDKAKQHDIKQFVMISSRDAGDPEHGTPAIKHYNICKHFADKHLIESHLPYTILRPGRLTDGPLTGKITTTRPADQQQQFISRTDVAACILQCLDHSETVNQIEELYQGEMPIQQAFIKSVKNRLG